MIVFRPLFKYWTDWFMHTNSKLGVNESPTQKNSSWGHSLISMHVKDRNMKQYFAEQKLFRFGKFWSFSFCNLVSTVSLSVASPLSLSTITFTLSQLLTVSSSSVFTIDSVNKNSKFSQPDIFRIRSFWRFWPGIILYRCVRLASSVISTSSKDGNLKLLLAEEKLSSFTKLKKL